MPPLRHSGFRISPTRARPVPFCLHGFLPLPETSARVLVLCVPDRWLARYCFTASCSRPSLTGPLKTSSERSSLPTTSFFRFLISTVAICYRPDFSTTTISARWSRHCSAQIEKIVFLIDARDAQVLHRDPLITQMSRHSHALDDARRKRRRTDRSRRAVEHRSVRLRGRRGNDAA